MANNLGLATCDDVYTGIVNKLATGAAVTMDDLNAQAISLSTPIDISNDGDKPTAPTNTAVDIPFVIDGIFP